MGKIHELYRLCALSLVLRVCAGRHRLETRSRDRKKGKSSDDKGGVKIFNLEESLEMDLQILLESLEKLVGLSPLFSRGNFAGEFPL